MSSFVNWVWEAITGTVRSTVTGAREESSSSESEDKSKPTGSTSKKSDNKVHKRSKKLNEDPTFSTKLIIPIESIIEETISEDISKKESKAKSKSKPSTSKTGVKKKSKTEKLKQKPNKDKLNKKSSESSPEKTTSEEDNDFEFLPVKKKRKPKPKTSPEGKTTQELNNLSVKKRPTGGDQIKKQTLSRKTEDFVFVVKGFEEKPAVIKESKKVSSTISYASVLTNDFTDSVDAEDLTAENLKKKELKELRESHGVESLIKQFEAGTVYHKHKDSSSIEVLSETASDTDFHFEKNKESELTASAEFLKVEKVEFNISEAQEAQECEINNPTTSIEQKFFEDKESFRDEEDIRVLDPREYNIQEEFEQNNFVESTDEITKLLFEDKEDLEEQDRGILLKEHNTNYRTEDFGQNSPLKATEENTKVVFKEEEYFEVGEHITQEEFEQNISVDATEESSKVIFEEQENPEIVLIEECLKDLISNIQEVDCLQDIERKNSIEDNTKVIFENQVSVQEKNTEELDHLETETQDSEANIPIEIEKEILFKEKEVIKQNITDEKINTQETEENIPTEVETETFTEEKELSEQDNIEVLDSEEDSLEEEYNKDRPDQSTPIIEKDTKVYFENDSVEDENIEVLDPANISSEEETVIQKVQHTIKDNLKVIYEDTEYSSSEEKNKINKSILEDRHYTEVEDNSEDLITENITLDQRNSTQHFEETVFGKNLPLDIINLEDKTEIIDSFSSVKYHDFAVPKEELIYNNQFEDTSIVDSLKDFIQQERNHLFESEVQVDVVKVTGDLNSKELTLTNFKQSSIIKQQTETLPYYTMSQVRVLSLNDKEHQDSTIYRIEKNWIIQFRLGPSLLGRKVNLFSNYPKENGGKLEKFDRCKYQLLSWCQDEGCKNADDTALFTQIQAKIAGSFHYYFVYENGENAERQGSGYFLIDPVLTYGEGEELPLDCIQCQTVLAKSLGPLSTWEKKLQVAKESGYNMIHFTPVQELGASNSSYSLSEQLKLNPVFNDEENGKRPTFEDVERLVGKLRKEWKISSICDIVLNHTANESEWLKTHPEVTYNCKNCPYMRPAYLLDAAFHRFSMDVKKGFYEDRGIPPEVCTEEHLNAIRYHFNISVLEPLKIHELMTADTEKLVAEFFDLARKTSPSPKNNHPVTKEEIQLIQDPQFRRLKTRIDMNLALKLFNTYRSDSFDEDTRLRKCAEDFKNKLDELNKRVIDTVKGDLHAALENVIAGLRYFRVQADGPKFKEISISKPLVYRYFTDFGTPNDIDEHEQTMYSDNGAFLMAHNGWVMNSDPLKNFADPSSKVYIRRELIAWGDSVKLRYGDSPSDCPFLWEHMRKYVELTAKIFDGVRLDNCHSTPLNVAEYLLDCARNVRPDLYVVAELFTNSDLTDNIFVNRLGITSLIREAMSAWDSHEEGRLVYRYGGVPVGSFHQPNVRPLVPTVAHALFLDLTHDNPSPVEKRSVFDMLPSTALVNMACCASGSNRGYDELVPHHIHVVDETRQYTEWTDDESLAKGNSRYVTKTTGIIAAKKAINNLHYKLGKEGFNQVYVDQMDPDIVAVTRHNPQTHESYVLVAYTAFSHPNNDADRHQKYIKPLRVEGVLDEIVFEATLSHINDKSGGHKFTKFEDFLKDSHWINGLSEYQVSVKEHIQVEQSDVYEKVDSGTENVTQLNFKNFKPGSVVVVKVSLPDDMREAVNDVRRLIKEEFSLDKNSELKQIIEKLKLSDLNRALYRCDQEERDEGYGFDVYNIPNFGSVVYAGLQGIMSLLANIRPNNDLGHPMCGNLRDGNWMIEYIWKRLKVDVGTRELGQWIEENVKSFNTIPRYLVPCYFDMVVTGIYVQLLDQCYKHMSGFVSNGSTFVKALSLGSLQFGAYIKSADLPTLSPHLTPPKPPTRTNEKGEVVQACVTLSAGLPHFAVGYMRNWGRDTFIALRGLFILTGRYQEAREHILGYAACIRHGLIPNLLDGGRNSRFNCRDAVWWWLFCIKEYVQEAPNGVDILKDKVSRLFPKDDSPPQPPGLVEHTLAQVMQEALNMHFQGLAFRERNAGKQIDEHMTDKGFNNQIGVHPETGFVFGGNEWNCGTWMDKMGSSDKAGNRGKPATPRDGSAIELIGLSKSVITWLHCLQQTDKYPYSGVERTHKNGTKTRWTFKEWSDKIQENFEKYFWVNSVPVQDEVRPDLINKRGIYKDSFGATQEWCDYQLRCNFPIAMVAAPELFNAKHAWIALQNAEKHLLGPLGMKTLDPSDWNYRGDYDNSNDSGDASVSHGFNYHQGPEWVWPVGFFLRAKLLFANQNGALKETLASTKVILSKHFVELQTSLWRGLPELTNSNGAYCRDSSRTQAWSMSCVLEVLHDLQQIESKQIVVN